MEPASSSGVVSHVVAAAPAATAGHFFFVSSEQFCDGAFEAAPVAALRQLDQPFIIFPERFGGQPFLTERAG